MEIARALATQPGYILLDEPLAGIDPIAVGEIRDLVSHLKDRGIGVLITDHNVRETLEIIDRAYIMHDGQVLMEGRPGGGGGARGCAPRLPWRKVQPVGMRAVHALASRARPLTSVRHGPMTAGHGDRPASRSAPVADAGDDAAAASGDQAAAISNIEVAAFVEEELERNPLLERDERDDAPPPERPRPTRSCRPNGAPMDAAEMARSDILPTEARRAAGYRRCRDLRSPAARRTARRAASRRTGSGGGRTISAPTTAASTTWRRRRRSPARSSGRAAAADASTTRSTG